MKAQTKALVASLVVIAFALTAVSGVTYSWFSDTEDTTIDITTGKIQLDLDSNVHVSSYGYAEKDVPAGTSVTTDLGGSISYNIASATATDSMSVIFNGAAPGDKLRISVSGNVTSTINVNYTESVEVSTTSGLVSPFEITGLMNIDNTKGASVPAHDIIIEMNAATGAEYMGMKYTITLRFQAVQANFKETTSTPITSSSSTNTSIISATADNTVVATLDVPTGAFSEDVTVKTTAIKNAGATYNVVNSAGQVVGGVDVSITNAGGDTRQPSLPVSVKIVVPGDITRSFKVFHENTEVTDVTAAYDSTTDKTTVCVSASSFSSYFVVDTSEAKIGDEKYATMSEALISAKDGDVVDILRNLTDVRYIDLSNNSDKKSITINLDSKKVEFSKNAMNLSGNIFLTIIDGSIITNTSSNSAAFFIEHGAGVTLRNVYCDVNDGSGFYPKGNASYVEIYDSKINAGVYAIGTNANKVDNYGVRIVIENSELKSSISGNDNCTVIINVEGTLNIKNSTITGGRQCLIVRAGSATVENTTLNYEGCSISSDDLKWRDGNNMVSSAIVVGSLNSTEYKANASLKITDSCINAESGSKTLVVAQDGKNGQTASVVIENSPTVTPNAFTCNGISFTAVDKSQVKITATVADSSEVIKSALDVDGFVSVMLPAGTYTDALSNLNGKSFVIGSNGGVLDFTKATALHDCKIIFNGVTLSWPNTNYNGIQHISSVEYISCLIKGMPFLYGENEVFTDCKFEQTSGEAYNLWTYGAKNVEFNSCTFNCAGRSVFIYNEGNNGSKVSFENCNFIASNKVDGKAAIAIDSCLLNTEDKCFEVTIKNCTSTGFGVGANSNSSLWYEKSGDKSVIIVDDVTVWKNGASISSSS